MKYTIPRIILSAALVLSQNGSAQELPDPTRPAEYQTTLFAQELPKALVDWKVSVIRISDTDRSAIVNGKIVKVGDAIGPAMILEIKNTSVLLDYENKPVEVRLFRDALVRKELSKSE
jgi:hypothetical protein